METRKRLQSFTLAFVVAIHIAGAFYGVSQIAKRDNERNRFLDTCNDAHGLVVGAPTKLECVRPDRTLIATLAP